MAADLNFDTTDFKQYKETCVVIPRHDMKTAADRVRNVLDTICPYVNDRNPLFSRKPVAIGSYASKLKVGEPNEFDYDVVLVGLSDNLSCSASEFSRFYCITKDGGTKRLQRTYDRQPDPPMGYYILALEEPALSDMHDLTADTHLVPLLVKQTFRELVTDAIEIFFPEIKIKQKDNGPAITIIIPDPDGKIYVDLVTVIPNIGTEILSDAWDIWPRTNRWPPADKTLWLWECEKCPYLFQWDRDFLPGCVMSIVTRLKYCLDKGKCPHYFNDKINLFEDILGRRLKNPNGLMETAFEVGKFLKHPRLLLEKATRSRWSYPSSRPLSGGELSIAW
ncbi:cyclic GMP-AMP synthase-like receptor 1 [Saccoglossus kowalevskii]